MSGMKRPSILLAFALPLALSTAGVGFAKEQRIQGPSPEPVFREIVSYDRRGGEQELFGTWRSPTMERLISMGLSLTWTRAASTTGNFFDASVFSGRQSVSGPLRYESVRTIRNDGRKAVVETIVIVPVESIPEQQRQHFTFVMEDGRWKLDEIDYAAGSKQGRFLHANMRAWMGGFMKDHVRNARSAVHPSGEDVPGIADRAVVRAKAVYGDRGMAGLKEEVERCGKASSAARVRVEVSDCLAFTWASLRIDRLGSAALGTPPQLRSREVVEPLENEYLRLGGRYQDAYDLSQVVGRKAGS